MNEETNATRQERTEETTVKERLLEFIKAKRLRQTDVTRALGVSSAYISSMRKSLPEEKVVTLCREFPDLNRDWLLYGEGEMLLPEHDGPDLTQGYIVPLLPIEAYAGNLQMWSSGVQLRDCEKVVSPVPGVDFAIRISGDSMEPEFQNGSMLFIKRINEKAFIPWGNPMVIDTENGVLVKAVYPVKRQDAGDGSRDRFGYDEDVRQEYIEARSYNPAYPPFLIPTESIYSLYRIVTGIKQYSTM